MTSLSGTTSNHGNIELTLEQIDEILVKLKAANEEMEAIRQCQIEEEVIVFRNTVHQVAINGSVSFAS